MVVEVEVTIVSEFVVQDVVDVVWQMVVIEEQRVVLVDVTIVWLSVVHVVVEVVRH